MIPLCSSLLQAQFPPLLLQQNVLYPSKIGLYPVHLHRLPEVKGINHGCIIHSWLLFIIVIAIQLVIVACVMASSFWLPSSAFSISSSLGVTLFLSNVYIDITIPGVQKPHCDPWALAMRSCVYIDTHSYREWIKWLAFSYMEL